MSNAKEYYFYDTDDDWFTFYWQDTKEGKAVAEQADREFTREYSFEHRKHVAYFDDKTKEENR